jgi:hypothetical protein
MPGVWCSRTAASRYILEGSMSKCVRILLLGLFLVEVLLDSTLKGGLNKRDTAAPRRRPLDTIKLEAIYSKLH